MSGVELNTAGQQDAPVSGSDAATQIVICLGPWYENATAEHLSPLLLVLKQALGPAVENALVAYPASDPQASAWQHEGMLLQPYLPGAKLHTLSVQTAATYLSLFEIMRAHSATCGLLLGAEAHTLQPSAIAALAESVTAKGADLAVARYPTDANEGLINAAILYPLTRAVFGVKAKFPLALDLALSFRMAEKMASAAQRFTSSSNPEALLWPVAEAVTASFTVADVAVGKREIPHPAGDDLSAILNTVASSLFLDVEAKAMYWQRNRPATNVLSVGENTATLEPAEPVDEIELASLVDSFHIAYGNLHEIWSLVLPPQTLLGLKRLSRLSGNDFSLPDALWVRIVYDFVLAHRMRTINRGHLMGALTPLYLAWVASHILAGRTSPQLATTEALAKAFEADKPYLVSRWRWPDRFNP